jgi:sugar phosphate isomerase/epimerase
MFSRIGINADSSTINGDTVILDKMLSVFSTVGFSHAEIPVHGLDCVINGILRPERLTDALRVLRKYPLAYTVHAPDQLNLADSAHPEIHTAALRSTIDFATEIGANIVVYHGSFLEKGSAEAREAAKGQWAAEIDRLGAIADYAANRGVSVAVENIFRQGQGEISYRTDPRELAAVISAVKSESLGICFDFGHAWISSSELGFTMKEALVAVMPRLLHVHIHDNFGKPSTGTAKAIDMMFQGAGDLHMPPGWGTIPYETLFPLFTPEFKGIYMLELRPRFGDRYVEALSWVLKMVEKR